MIKRVVSVGAGWRLYPAISREELSQILGCDVPFTAWQEISEAVAALGQALDALDQPRDTAEGDRNSGRGYRAERLKARRDIEKAFELIEGKREGAERAAWRSHGMLEAFEQNAQLSEAKRLHSAGTSAQGAYEGNWSICTRLDDASRLLLEALWIIDAAEPFSVEVIPESAARQKVIRNIFDAHRTHGLPSTRTGTERRRDSAIQFGALTPFERGLWALLGDHRGGDGQTAGAWAEYVDKALRGARSSA